MSFSFSFLKSLSGAVQQLFAEGGVFLYFVQGGFGHGELTVARGFQLIDILGRGRPDGQAQGHHFHGGRERVIHIAYAGVRYAKADEFGEFVLQFEAGSEPCQGILHTRKGEFSLASGCIECVVIHGFSPLKIEASAEKGARIGRRGGNFVGLRGGIGRGEAHVRVEAGAALEISHVLL